MLKEQYLFLKHEASVAANINASKMANLMCPFCVQNKVFYNGRIKRKKEGLPIKKFYCTNCKRNFVQSKYYNFKKPDFIIDAFLDIMQIKPFSSITQIQKLIYERTKQSVNKGTIGKWRDYLRKGRLREYYLPNSRLNKVVSPKQQYIPKKTEYTRKGVKQVWYYNEDRIQKALNFLEDKRGKIVKAKMIREAYHLNVGSPLKKTPLAKLGYIKKIADDNHPVNGGYWQVSTDFKQQIGKVEGLA